MREKERMWKDIRKRKAGKDSKKIRNKINSTLKWYAYLLPHSQVF